MQASKSTNDNGQGFFPNVSGCAYFLNSAANPFLYSLVSKQFRSRMYKVAFKRFDKRFFWKRRRDGNSLVIRQIESLDGGILNRYRNQQPRLHRKIPSKNCKGHVQTSIAIRRHLGLRLSPVVDNHRPRSHSISPNIPFELTAFIHGKIEDPNSTKTHQFIPPNTMNTVNEQRHLQKCFMSDHFIGEERYKLFNCRTEKFLSDPNIAIFSGNPEIEEVPKCKNVQDNPAIELNKHTSAISNIDCSKNIISLNSLKSHQDHALDQFKNNNAVSV